MFNTNPDKLNKLVAGQKAPLFTTKDALGKPISLSGIDKRYILLVFFRYAGCAWCNLAIHRLSLEYKTLKDHDCEAIAFVQSDEMAIDNNIYQRHAKTPKFSIIADRDQKYYSQYGITDSIPAAVKSIKSIPAWMHSVKDHGFKQDWVDGNLFLVPASFLIDGRTLKIIQSNYGSSYYEAEAFMDIYQSVFFKEL